MHFVILKGAEGFADRMTCLLQAIEYAKVTNRILVVDWRDPDWMIEPVGLEAYLTINGVDTLSAQEFCLRLNKDFKVLEDDVYPRAWIASLDKEDCSEVIRSHDYQLKDLGAEIALIVNREIPDFAEKYVVLPGVNQRIFQMDTFKNIQLSDDLSSYIQECACKLSLKSQKYDVIHIRAGSKNWFGGRVREDSPVYNLHNKWKTEEEYMETLWSTYLQLTAGSEKQRLYYLSDHGVVASRMAQRYNKGYYLNHSMSRINVPSFCGIHKEKPTDHGATKKQVNFECMRDFVIMVNSRFLVGDDASMFSRLALCIKAESIPFGGFGVV